MLNISNFKNIVSLLVLGCAAGLNSCSTNNSNNIAQAQETPNIVASHNILCDLIETIAEDTVNLTCLIDSSQNPHTYRPTPSQGKAIEEAQLILYGGYQLEPQIVELIEATETPAPKIPVYEQVVTEPIQTSAESHSHSEESHSEESHSEESHSEESHSEESHSEESHSEKSDGEKAEELQPDPHVWLNVENAVKMVELIQPILLQLNPQAAEQYLQNTTTLTETLWQLDTWIDEQIATIPQGRRVLVTTHDSFNYYAQAYYLEDYHTLQGLSSESSPTASQVKKLATEIEETGVPTIFVEFTTSDRVMRNVARTAKVEVSPDTLYADGLGEADNYIEMMSHNTCSIVNGLGGECQEFGK